MHYLILAIALATFAPFAAAVPLEGDVKFETADTTGFVHIKGDGAKITGDTDKELTVDLAAFDTHDKLRNEHMRDKYFETGKFPTATLKLDPVKSGPTFTWTGLLTIKGQTKPVKGKATLNGKDLWAEFIITIGDFPAIGTPEFKDIKLSLVNDVTIDVKAKLK